MEVVNDSNTHNNNNNNDNNQKKKEEEKKQKQNDDYDGTQPEPQSQTSPSKRKVAGKSNDINHNKNKGNETHITSRNPPWTYLKLQLITQPGPSTTSASTPTSTSTTLDALTARTYLTSALSQFLGLTGTAIPIDILKIDSSESESKSTPASIISSKSKLANHSNAFLWIRVPREDASAVVAALSSWIGGGSSSSSGSSSTGSLGGDLNVAWRVCAKGNYLAGIVHGAGEDLFQS